MITLEQIIIERGDLEKIYRANTSLRLWRALNIEDAHLIHNPLYPDFEPRELKNGDIRAPDVETYIDEETGSEHIKSQEGFGTSLVDKPGIFGKTK